MRDSFYTINFLQLCWVGTHLEYFQDPHPQKKNVERLQIQDNELASNVKGKRGDFSTSEKIIRALGENEGADSIC